MSDARGCASIATPASSGAPVVRLRGLEKRFGARRALAGVDLDIGDRQIFGIAGPDGAGKTTLLRTLAGLLEIKAVEARVLGFDLKGPVDELKLHTGYVPQTFSLHRALTVAENLAFTARLHRMPRDRYEARARELLEHAGLAEFRNRPAGALSGGMRQKLAISNALLPDPRIVLLDEPTAGVDVMARAELWSILSRAADKALVVISTSYIDEIAACHAIAYLHEGRVVATGSPDALQDATRLDLYRAWGDDPRTVARAARTLPYVFAARGAGRYARIELRRGQAPDERAVLGDLTRVSGAHIHFGERRPADMESTLLWLAGQA